MRIPFAALALALLAAPGAAAAFSLLEAEQRDVREGNERLVSGDAEGALRSYDAAEKAAGPRAEIDFDRGAALYRLGRHAEARDAWRRALERGAGPLSSPALQNVGNALASSGDVDGAMAAYAEALRKDPRNEDARYDLEVLLRRKAAGAPPPSARGEQQPKPGGRDDEQQARQGEQAERQQQQGKERPQQEAQGPDPERDAQRGEPQRAQADRGEPERPEPRPAEGREETRTASEREGPAARPAPLDRQEAERLLDALRERERNMPLGRRERKDGRRADAEKDW
jgi:tetratricopeptide (TPR) repeat protein